MKSVKLALLTAVAALVSIPALAGPIEALRDGRFQVNICEINGNQLGIDRVFNFRDTSSRHISGGRTDNSGCVVTKLSNVRSGDTVILEVEQRDGGITRGSYTLPRARNRGRHNNLGGYCPSDSDFQRARDFAYSSSGLDLTSAAAGEWGLNYGRTHRCGTIEIYIERFKALYNLAYGTQYMDMTKAAAIDYARDQADFISNERIARLTETFAAVKDLAYSTQYMDRTKQKAIEIAKEWIMDSACENGDYVNSRIKPEYKRLFDFAYSSRGLDMTKEAAQAFALERLGAVTICADVLAQ